jgi:hypothetical protein
MLDIFGSVIMKTPQYMIYLHQAWEVSVVTIPGEFKVLEKLTGSESVRKISGISASVNLPAGGNWMVLYVKESELQIGSIRQLIMTLDECGLESLINQVLRRLGHSIVGINLVHGPLIRPCDLLYPQIGINCIQLQNPGRLRDGKNHRGVPSAFRS